MDKNKGEPVDASLMGAVYSVVFHENGKADFVMAGASIKDLPWKEIGGDFVIDYSGNPIACTPNAEGLSMDFFGSLILQMNPEE